MHSSRRLFLKQIGFGTVGFSLLASMPEYHNSYDTDKYSLPRSSPEQQGVTSAGIEAFLDAVAKSKIEFHSIMIVRHGHVIAEGWWSPYAASLKHKLYSLSKSFTSTAVGLAIAEGRFTVESPVTSFFPNDVPKEVSANLAAMKVKHLLTMSSGHAKDTMPSLRNSAGDSWSKVFLSLPVDLEPGSSFLYNTGATYMLSAIVQKVTGQPLLQYLRPRLFDPLGIFGEDWETDPQGINAGGFGLRIKTEDAAKLGQLYLQKGMWNGKQILSSSWVEEATSAKIPSRPGTVTRPQEEDDWAQGYGYQFWRCRHNAYRADGAFGQFSIVLPDYDAVVAITEESFRTQETMNLVWSYLLPAMNASALPANSNEQTKLTLNLNNLSLVPIQQNATSPTASRVTGKEFTLDSNVFNAKSLLFTFGDDNCVLSVNTEKVKYKISCGLKNWVEVKSNGTGIQTPFPVRGRTDIASRMVASATWSDEHTLSITCHFIEIGHSDRLTCIFDGNTVTVKFLNSISQGNPTTPEERVDLIGHS